MNSNDAASAVIAAQKVRLARDRKRIEVPASGLTEAVDGQPLVKVIREGDLVRGVEVTCSCGQCVRLHFETI